MKNFSIGWGDVVIATLVISISFLHVVKKRNAGKEKKRISGVKNAAQIWKITGPYYPKLEYASKTISGLRLH